MRVACSVSLFPLVSLHVFLRKFAILLLLDLQASQCQVPSAECDGNEPVPFPLFLGLTFLHAPSPLLRVSLIFTRRARHSHAMLGIHAWSYPGTRCARHSCGLPSSSHAMAAKLHCVLASCRNMRNPVRASASPSHTTEVSCQQADSEALRCVLARWMRDVSS